MKTNPTQCLFLSLPIQTYPRIDELILLGNLVQAYSFVNASISTSQLFKYILSSLAMCLGKPVIFKQAVLKSRVLGVCF